MIKIANNTEIYANENLEKCTVIQRGTGVVSEFDCDNEGQILQISTTDRFHSINHRFLKMTSGEWETLLLTNGFKSVSWMNPFSGTLSNPTIEEIPEFYVLCEVV